MPLSLHFQYKFETDREWNWKMKKKIIISLIFSNLVLLRNCPCANVKNPKFVAYVYLTHEMNFQALSFSVTSLFFFFSVSSDYIGENQ